MEAPKSLRTRKKGSVKAKTWRKPGTGKDYDTRQWRTNRALHLQAYPLCIACESKGFTVEATVSDHIIPINEVKEDTIERLTYISDYDEDFKRRSIAKQALNNESPLSFIIWNWINRQPLCDTCHNIKTGKESRQ